MLSALLLWAVLCACVVWWWRTRVREARAHPLPPACADQLPFIGHIHKLITDSTNLWELAKFVAKSTTERGGVSYCNFGPQIYYLITDPEDALTVANTCLKKNFMYDFAKYWLGQGLITGSGEVWHRHRKLLNPVFSLPVIHGFLRVFNSQSRELLSTIDPYVGISKFDILPHIKNTILNISCLTAFGESSVKDKTFFLKYMKAVEDLLHVLMLRVQQFWLQSDTIYTLLGYKKKEVYLVKILKEMSDKAIAEHRKSRTASVNVKNSDAGFNNQARGIGYQPILDLMLQQKNKDPLNDNEIREELDTTIVAGYETSSNLLVTVLALIGTYPEVQEKMYKEIMQIVGPERDVEKEDLQKLVYTDAVIKESLRVLPTVPGVGRYIDKDVKLKTCTLREGSNCILSLIGINCHPSWGADADQFRPERWLDGASLLKNPNTFAAFSFGKRSCIGRTYATISAKVVLAHIVRKYRLTADHTKMKFKLDITLKPVEGHEVTLLRKN